MLSRNMGIFLSTLFLFFLLAPRANADTYAEFSAANPNGDLYYYFYNNEFIGFSSTTLQTYSISYTGVVTPLSSEPTPAVTGSPCALSDIGAYTYVTDSICNNGFEAFVGHPPGAGIFGGIYHGPNPATDELYNGPAGLIRVDSLGDIAFTEYGGLADATVVFFDLTSRAAPVATPEPNSALLIATALLFLCGLRFRFAHS